MSEETSKKNESKVYRVSNRDEVDLETRKFCVEFTVGNSITVEGTRIVRPSDRDGLFIVDDNIAQQGGMDISDPEVGDSFVVFAIPNSTLKDVYMIDSVSMNLEGVEFDRKTFRITQTDGQSVTVQGTRVKDPINKDGVYVVDDTIWKETNMDKSSGLSLDSEYIVAAVPSATLKNIYIVEHEAEENVEDDWGVDEEMEI